VLDRLNAPGWVCGAVGSVLALLWVVWFAVMWNEETKPLAGYGDEAKPK
jgi:hypothetical protein